MKSKKVEQAQRLTHAALCEHWSMYWVYHPSRQYDFDLEIMIFALLLLLFYLWKDSIF
ncbi:hypothetical protein BDQ17DRAFT_1350887 [Cyathus striatus]|nr:hypothetical protein BDQ17DRAFT_1350887 [Cyathus striatus]